MNLVRAELARLSTRRFVRLMLVLLIAAFGITVATTLAGSHTPTASEIANAERQADEIRQQREQLYQQCLQLRDGDRLPGYPTERFPDRCEQLRGEEPDPVDFLYGVFVFDEQIRPLTYFLIAFLSLFGFLVGASFIGAELTSGGMTNLLLWRPQRIQVLGAKLGTLLATVAAISLVSAVLYLGAFRLIAQVVGFPGDLDTRFWSSLAGLVGRGLVLVLLSTALGFALATLGRHTAAAMGALAAYAVVWEGGVRIVMEIVETARPDQWMLSTYLGAWVTDGIRLWDRGGCIDQIAGFCNRWYTISGPLGLAVLLTLVGGSVLAAFVNFNRRDLASTS